MARYPGNPELDKNWNPMQDHFQSNSKYPSQARQGSDSGDEKEKSLYVSNISGGVTADGLRGLLGSAGKIWDLALKPDKNRPNSQFAFVKTSTAADALRIIEKFNNFTIQDRCLRVQFQRPRRRPEDGSAGSNPSNGSGDFAATSPHANVPSDSEQVNAERNSVFLSQKLPEDPGRPVGRSKLLIETARQQVPVVGKLKAGPCATNGFGNQPCVDSAKTQSQMNDRERSSKQPSPELKQTLPSIQREPPRLPKEPALTSVVAPKSSNAQKTGPCLRCGKIGQKTCARCRQLYCSRECQRDDWPEHKQFCKTFVQVDEDFESQFEVNLSENLVHQIAEVFQEEAKFPRTILPLDVPAKALFLVPAFSPSEFYVFPEKNKETLAKLHEQMYTHYNNEAHQKKLSAVPKVGDICASQFSVDDLWYRAEVEAIIGNGKTLVVRYIDYGNKEVVELARTCCLDKEFSSFPYQAVPCCLENIEPIGGGWSEAAIRLSQELMSPDVNCHGAMTVVPVSHATDVYDVRLIGADGADVGTKLVEAGLAKFKKTPTPQKSTLTPQKLTPMPQKSTPTPQKLTPTSQSSPKLPELALPKKMASPVKALLSDRPATSEPGDSVNLTKFGWPADLTHLIGRRKSFVVVEFVPPGDLWVRFDPEEGCDTPPLMRLSLLDKYQVMPLNSPSGDHLPVSREAEEVVLKPTLKFERYFLDDLPLLKLEKEVNVEVTLPEGPGSFWCHDLLQVAPLDDQQKRLAPSFGQRLDTYIPENCEVCMGFYEKYKEWYRVLVMEEVSGDSVRAFLIDYGDQTTIPLNQVRPLPTELTSFPPMAFKCRLSLWNALQAMSPDIATRFQELVQNKHLICKIMEHNAESDLRTVVLTDSQSGQSVAIVLMGALEGTEL